MTEALTRTHRQSRTDTAKADPEESDRHQEKIGKTERQSPRIPKNLETEGEDRGERVKPGDPHVMDRIPTERMVNQGSGS